jgi:hypothetical protein
VPYTSNARRAAALWSILGASGRRVAVVGWWTTWPAESVPGVIVSDRMLYNRFNLWLGQERFGADLPGQTHPPELFGELAAVVQGEPASRQEFFARFTAGGAAPELREDLHDPWYELFLAWTRDTAYLRMLRHVEQSGPYDFLAFYLNGPDIASHYFWKYPPTSWRRGPT